MKRNIGKFSKNPLISWFLIVGFPGGVVIKKSAGKHMAHYFDLKHVNGALVSYCSQCGETMEFLSDPARFVDGVPPRCLFAPLGN